MKALIRVTLALAAATLASPVLAAETLAAPTPAGVAAHQAAVVQQQARIAQMMSKRTAATDSSATGAGTNAVQSTVSGPRIANPYRSYPPSCAADPLPTAPTGFTYTVQVALYTRSVTTGDPGTPEGATITLWRMACSSSGNLTPYNIDNGPNSMLMMRIDRSSNGQDFLPTFPFITAVQQGGNGPATAFVRSAQEPNTVRSEVPFDAAISAQSSVFVLENYPDTSFGYTYFNNDFQLLIDPVIDANCTGCGVINVPGYVPDQQHYPAAFLNLPIDGYMSSAWYDTAHGGEGLMAQIYDNADHATRTLFAAWYTYDDNGIPFWLSVQGVAAYGSNTFSNVPVYYFTGGGFAGNFTSVTQHNWGTMNISFPDCTTMEFDFNGAADAVAGGPAGSGSRTFHRLADINGLNCE
jgi:hypothetical protein